MTEQSDQEIDSIVADVETGGTHWDKHSLVRIIRQLKTERDKARAEADSLVNALAYGVRELR